MTWRELTGFSTELVGAYRRNDATRGSILQLQARRVDELLRVARTTRRYAGLWALTHAPVIDKATLQAAFDDVLVPGAPTKQQVQTFLATAAPAALLHGRYIAATTSGTTGEMGIFVVDDASFARLRATTFARLFRGLLRPEGFALLAKRRYRMTFVVATGGHTMTSVLALRMPAAGRVAADVRVVSIDEPVARQVASLNEAPPLLLHSYATVLEVLAFEQLAGRLRIAPELISAGSEVLTAAARATLAAAFPTATILETWAATEHTALAVGCAHGHLHINEDAALVEAVDADDRPVAVGALSHHVVVTNLLNHTQPLLRYRIDDRVRLVADRCPCGSPFQRVEVEGRTDDTIYLDDGVEFQAHTPIPLEIALLGTPQLQQFQLVHCAQNELVCRVVCASGAEAIVVEQVRSRLSRYLEMHGLLQRVSLNVEPVGSLRRHERSGKLRQITSEVVAPQRSIAAALRRRELP